MPLTVTERQHWKDRIASRIDRAITAVYCEDDPGLLKRVEAEAKRQAAATLGLDELLEQREQIASESERLGREQLAVNKRLVAAVTGRHKDEVTLPYYDQNRSRGRSRQRSRRRLLRSSSVCLPGTRSANRCWNSGVRRRSCSTRSGSPRPAGRSRSCGRV